MKEIKEVLFLKAVDIYNKNSSIKDPLHSYSLDGNERRLPEEISKSISIIYKGILNSYKDSLTED